MRFGIYFNRKLCLKFELKYLIFLENINIGHMKISRDYFWPPKFSDFRGLFWPLPQEMMQI